MGGCEACSKWPASFLSLEWWLAQRSWSLGRRSPGPAWGLTRVPLVVTVQATWMAYDMVVMRTNPSLAEAMRRLEDAFLSCKEEMEKNWQELLSETKREQ